MVKVVTLFLVAMAVLAIFGRLRLPGSKRPKRLARKTCPSCGAPLVGRSPCPCGRS